MYEYVRTLRQRVRDLEAQLAEARTERNIALIDRQCAVDQLTHALQIARDPGDIPAELVHALRSVSACPQQGVRLTAAGRELHVLVDGAGYDADLGTEGKVWAWLVDHAGTSPEHPFARADMPDRLYGVARPDGQITISAHLTRDDAAAARRALRAPQRGCGLLRALGLLLVIGGAAGRAVLGLLRDAQAAAGSATSAAASTVTAAAGSALPAVTAAAISCTAVTSCAPQPGTGSAAPPPAEVLIVEHTEPNGAVTAPADSPRKPARRKPAPGETEGARIPEPVPEPEESPVPPKPLTTEPVPDAEPVAPRAPAEAETPPAVPELPPADLPSIPQDAEGAPGGIPPDQAADAPVTGTGLDSPEGTPPDAHLHEAGEPADDGSALDDPPSPALQPALQPGSRLPAYL